MSQDQSLLVKLALLLKVLRDLSATLLRVAILAGIGYLVWAEIIPLEQLGEMLTQLVESQLQ